MKHILITFLLLASLALGQERTSALKDGSNIVTTGGHWKSTLGFLEAADVSGAYEPLIADGGLSLAKLAQASATSGQVIKWNGSAWAPAEDTGGTVDNAAVVSAIEENPAAIRDAANAAEVDSSSGYLKPDHRSETFQGLAPRMVSAIKTRNPRVFIMGDSLVGNGFYNSWRDVIGRKYGIAGYGPGFIEGKNFLSGGATNDNALIGKWFNTEYLNIPVGGSAIFKTFGGIALPVLGDTIKIYYVKSPGAGEMSIYTSTDDGSTWSAAEAVVNTADASEIGAVAALSVKSEPDWYVVKVTNTGVSGNLIVVGAEISNSRATGVILSGAWRGGLGINQEAAVPPAILGPIMASIAPDIVIHNNTDDAASVNANLPTLVSNIRSALPNLDWIEMGQQPGGIDETGTPDYAELQVAQNEAKLALCKANKWNFIPVLQDYSFREINEMGLMGWTPKTISGVAADVITTSTAHGMGTPTQFLVTSTESLPSPLQENTQYHAIVTGANTFKVAATKADALAGTFIPLTGAGSGTRTLKVTDDIHPTNTGFDTIAEHVISQIPISDWLKRTIKIPATPTHAFPDANNTTGSYRFYRNKNTNFTFDLKGIGSTVNNLFFAQAADSSSPSGLVTLKNYLNITALSYDPQNTAFGINANPAPTTAKLVVAPTLNRTPIRIIQPSQFANFIDGTTSGNVGVSAYENVIWRVTPNGSFEASTAGQGFIVKSGANARIGSGLVMVAGVHKLANSTVTANTHVSVTKIAHGGTAGAGGYLVGRIVGSLKSVTAVDAGTDTITSAAHGYVNGDPIFFSGTTVPPGLTAGTPYYVSTATTDTFKVATTFANGISGASPVNITDTGTSVSVRSTGFSITAIDLAGSLVNTDTSSFDWYLMERL